MLFSKGSTISRNSLLISRRALSVLPPRKPDPVRVRLPPQHKDDKGKITLVLDMDETLVHSMFDSEEADQRQAEIRKPATEALGLVKFTLTLSDGERVRVNCRPYLKPFLQHIADKYEPVVYTAALPIYANAVLDNLDPDRKIFRHRLFRHDCSMPRELHGNYAKDLRVLGRDLRRTVLVDNNPVVFFHQPENGIPIKSFYDDAEDAALLKLMQFLPELEQRAVEGDLRPVLQQLFNTKMVVEKIAAGFLPNGL